MKKIFRTVLIMLLFLCSFTGCSDNSTYYARIVSISNEKIEINLIETKLSSTYNEIEVEKDIEASYYVNEYGNLDLKEGDIISFDGDQFFGWNNIKNINVIRNINDLNEQEKLKEKEK